MSSASARVRPTQAATISPTYRTLPWARIGSRGCLKPGAALAARIDFTPARCSAVKTASRCRSGTRTDTQPRMGDGAAHEGDVAGAGNAEIGDILAAPAQEALVLLARNGSADTCCEHVVRSFEV